MELQDRAGEKVSLALSRITKTASETVSERINSVPPQVPKIYFYFFDFWLAELRSASP